MAIHSACQIYFSKLIASLGDVGEREGRAFVLNWALLRKCILASPKFSAM